MGRRLVLAVVVSVAVLAACERRDVEESERAERPARAEADGAPARPSPEGRRASEGKPSGRRGDRHARAAARKSPKVKRVEGTLAGAGARRVVIRPRGAPPMTLRVAPSTTVTVDGRPARVEDLREGSEVRASYETGTGGRPTAVRIEARAAQGGEAPRRSPPEPPPDPPSGG